MGKHQTEGYILVVRSRISVNVLPHITTNSNGNMFAHVHGVTAMTTYLSADNTLQKSLWHAEILRSRHNCRPWRKGNMGNEIHVPHDKSRIEKGVFSARIHRPACSHVPFPRFSVVMQYAMAANKDCHQHLQDVRVDFEFWWFECGALRRWGRRWGHFAHYKSYD
ncbi:hypothetical protein DEU56DRAFT_753383 [Suillus clintonianus]|uniref:uncharacterized protein n=1 Tax=Suillus clintonianus TaxID=1904413 RepID=UPI001B8635A3|nr:uncharacterized protein DEU56DRAFT_753383 [Suillus clintonianus]KAG2147526.1 hypothetical protein DEU56DRAFT_753383 [Suillus clintonianus]